MKVSVAASFEKAYRGLGPEERKAVKAALVRLESDPDHPGLNLEKLSSGYYSIRATRGCRVFLSRKAPDTFEAFNVGGHDLYRRVR